jgi:hypothetical protein
MSIRQPEVDVAFFDVKARLGSNVAYLNIQVALKQFII